MVHKGAPRKRPTAEHRSNLEERRMYRTKRWGQIRQLVLNDAGGLCMQCLKRHVYSPATDIDHVIPVRVRPDLKWDPQNLQALCKTCHSKKTADGG